MSETHTPFCQYKGCNKRATQYDDRHGRIIFFCTGLDDGHFPMAYSGNSFNKSVQLECGSCGNLFRVDGIEEEVVEDFECPDCGVEERIVVAN